MKLNFVKYYLVLLVGLCVASPRVDAFTISDVLSSTLTESLVVDVDLDSNIQYWGPGLTMYGYNYDGSVITDFSSKNFKSFFRVTSPATGFSKIYTTLVSMSSNGQGGGILKWWSEQDGEYFDFNIPSSAGFTRNFPDGESCLMDQVFFTIGSAVFYSSGCDRTLQVMAGGNVWTDYFLYIDPNPNHTTNNLWLVSLSRDVAWSTSVSNVVAGDLMLAKIVPSQQTVLNIFNDNGYISYTVSGGGSNFRPTDPAIPGFVGQSGFPQGLPLVYSRDLQLNPLPEWSGGSGNNNVDLSGNVIDNSFVYTQYGSCSNKVHMLETYLHLREQCDYDQTGFVEDMLIWYGGEDGAILYTGSVTSQYCQDFISAHNAYHNKYSDNWYDPPYEPNFFDINLPFLNLALSWHTYNYGTPFTDQFNCELYAETQEDTQQVNQSKLERQAGNIFNKLAIPFQSGYNSVSTYTCNVNDGVITSFGDILLYFTAGLLAFILFIVF